MTDPDMPNPLPASALCVPIAAEDLEFETTAELPPESVARYKPKTSKAA